MSNKSTTYYLILDRMVGKKENDVYYVFKDGKWVHDRKCRIKDRLIGYDSSEPAGSPYAFGNTDIMDQIETITEERAMEIIKEQIKTEE